MGLCVKPHNGIMCAEYIVMCRNEVYEMGRTDNLINLSDRDPEDRRRIASMGGKARQKQIERQRKLKEELLLLLSDEDTQKAVCTSLIEAAKRGNAAAFVAIRDSIGESPRAKVDVTATQLISGDVIDDLDEEEFSIVAGTLLSERSEDKLIESRLSIAAKQKLLSRLLDG